MPVSENFTSILSQKWYINFTQCSPDGCLKYTELCNILQLTAGAHAKKGGISFADMQAFDQAWVLSRFRIEIQELPKWGDRIMVKTWIVSLENSRSVRALEVYVNDQKIIGAETFWAVINTNLRRPEALALPHAHFEKYPEKLSTEERVKKVVFDREGETVGMHKVVLSDLDIVNHVNNVKYLEWCLDAMDAKDVVGGFSAFDMNFMQELLYADEVEICRSGNVFSVEKDGKSCFLLEVEGVQNA